MALSGSDVLVRDLQIAAFKEAQLAVNPGPIAVIKVQGGKPAAIKRSRTMAYARSVTHPQTSTDEHQRSLVAVPDGCGRVPHQGESPMIFAIVTGSRFDLGIAHGPQSDPATYVASWLEKNGELAIS
jgi:hypothetical protein